MKKITIKVLERKWKVTLLDPDDFHRRFKEDAKGFTLTDTKEIVFVDDEDFTLGVVIHELVHAYFDGICTASAFLTLDQQEESFAEMFETYGISLIKLARRLYRELKK